MQEVIGSTPIFSTFGNLFPIRSLTCCDNSETVENKTRICVVPPFFGGDDTAESMSGASAFVAAVPYQVKVAKGARWMPWLTEAMKDAISCDNPRVGANDL